MFEVLLQADRALASGSLDQAERAYWQLVELDPTNAIAVAGLARVSLERGDRMSARTFAERALAMDPELVGARKLIDLLNTSSGGVTSVEAPDAAMLAARQLETFGRRRAAGETGDNDRPAPDHPAGDRPAGSDAAAPADSESGRKSTRKESGKPLPQLPPEVLKDRRQAGRNAAAAAAAAAEAAPRPTMPARSGEPRAGHQALGDRARRLMTPEVKREPRSQDPFWAAESAAAIEAVDSLDDTTAADALAPAAADELGNILGAVEATDEEDSVAMRIALLTGAPEMDSGAFDAAEKAAGLPARQPGRIHSKLSEQESAELDQAAARIEFDATEAELAAIEAESVELDEVDLAAARIEFAATEAELAAIEAESLEIAMAAVAEQLSDGAFEEAERAAAERPSAAHAAASAGGAVSADDARVEDAETGALHEAMALVVDADPAEKPEHGSAQIAPEAPDAAEAPPPSESILDADQKSASEPRKKGLFRRFRGD
jgi:hypothetical protein